MGNTEIFELCETASKKQCPDCALCWEIGIVHCSCERCFNLRKVPKSWTRRTMTPYQLPVTSSKRNLTHGAKHGASERQRMYHEAKKMLQKARQPKHGGYKTILERWHKDYRKSLSEIGWTEEQIIQYDEHALEDHSYIATKEERNRNDKSWALKLNKEGVRGPMNQRPDFVEAKREMKKTA